MTGWNEDNFLERMACPDAETLGLAMDGAAGPAVEGAQTLGVLQTGPQSAFARRPGAGAPADSDDERSRGGRSGRGQGVPGWDGVPGFAGIRHAKGAFDGGALRTQLDCLSALGCLHRRDYSRRPVAAVSRGDSAKRGQPPT